MTLRMMTLSINKTYNYDAQNNASQHNDAPHDIQNDDTQY
jgi:hypothetical protein